MNLVDKTTAASALHSLKSFSFSLQAYSFEEMMQKKKAYVVTVISVDGAFQPKLYLVDWENACYIKMFDSEEELRVYADLNGYDVTDAKQTSYDI